MKTGLACGALRHRSASSAIVDTRIGINSNQYKTINDEVLSPRRRRRPGPPSLCALLKTRAWYATASKCPWGGLPFILNDTCLRCDHVQPELLATTTDRAPTHLTKKILHSVYESITAREASRGRPRCHNRGPRSLRIFTEFPAWFGSSA